MTEKSHQNLAHSPPEKDCNIQDQSRRNFLNSAGCAAMGGLAVAAGSTLFTGKEASANAPQAAPPLPWVYKKLDPKEAGKRGYKNYLAKGG